MPGVPKAECIQRYFKKANKIKDHYGSCPAPRAACPGRAAAALQYPRAASRCRCLLRGKRRQPRAARPAGIAGARTRAPDGGTQASAASGETTTASILIYKTNTPPQKKPPQNNLPSNPKPPKLVLFLHQIGLLSEIQLK